jgi:two-component system, OmpR family, sensor kinase
VFSRRLSIALGALATASILQGGLAWFTSSAAEMHIQRGRVAADILSGFLELSATKQQLRTWLSQALLDAGADPLVRDKLQSDMAETLTKLEKLAAKANASRIDDNQIDPEFEQRQLALTLLRQTLMELRLALSTAKALPQGVDAVVAWQELTRVFNQSEGADLRTVLAQSISREQTALVRERAAADKSLALALSLALAATGATALMAAILAVYFARALRRPLDELRAGAIALQAGNFQHRVPTDLADEFSQFATSVNSMATELEQYKENEVLARHRLEDLVNIRTVELQNALEKLQSLDVRRRKLFADISHELKTPTTAIRGEAEIALRGNNKSTEEYRSSLTRIVEAVSYLTGVIDDLLTMAKSDIDALSLIKEPVNVADPLREAIEQARAVGLSSNITIDVQEETLRSATILADASRLRQLFTILIDNALRYSFQNGTVYLSTRIDRSDESKPYWELSIIDKGIGVEVSELPHLFDRNFRGSRARLHRADGSGLGLAIALVLARSHDGNIIISPGVTDSNILGAALGTVAVLSLPITSNVIEFEK